MPRKTGTAAVTQQRTPYEKGATIIDSEGDSITQDDRNALRVYPLGTGDDNLSSMQTTLDASLIELRKIRRANEILIDQEVDEPED